MCSQAAARLMVEQGGGGNIIIIGSMHSMATFPGMLAYASTKGGLNAMTRAMALDLAPHRIRVNCVIPGSIHVEKAYEVIPNYDPHMIDDQIALGPHRLRTGYRGRRRLHGVAGCGIYHWHDADCGWRGDGAHGALVR